MFKSQYKSIKNKFFGGGFQFPRISILKNDTLSEKLFTVEVSQ